jgi:hypothetical protein
MSKRRPDSILGEYPDLSGEEKISIAFLVAITCRHGYAAPSCGQGCRRPDWRECLVRKRNELDPTEPQPTVGEVAGKFLDAGRVASIEERPGRSGSLAMVVGFTTGAACHVLKMGSSSHTSEFNGKPSGPDRGLSVALEQAR